MEQLIPSLGLMLIGYLLGSLPFGLWVAKLWAGINIREYGSGNIGVSNVLRTVGLIPAVIVLVLDAGKGLVPVLLAQKHLDSEVMWLVTGICAVLGHSLPIFGKFKGGRGVATACGVLLALSWKVLLVLCLVWFGTLLVSRFISLASILAAIALPISFAVFAYPVSYIVLGILLGAFVIWRHRPNIQRLMAGTEYRIGEKVHKH